jgi:hypothetical protein
MIDGDHMILRLYHLNAPFSHCVFPEVIALQFLVVL